MATTVTRPADPVTQGASLIQATTFIPILTDFTQVDAKLILDSVKEITSEYIFDGVPTQLTAAQGWQWYLRNDQTGYPFGQRQIVAIRAENKSRAIAKNIPASGIRFNANLVRTKVFIKSWTAEIVTLDNGVTYTEINDEGLWTNIFVDPSSGAYLAPSYRSLYQILGFLHTPVAAAAPSYDGLFRAAAKLPLN